MEEKNDGWSDGWKAFLGLTVIGIILWMLVGGILRCAGIEGGDGINDAPWEPRHTEIVKEGIILPPTSIFMEKELQG